MKEQLLTLSAKIDEYTLIGATVFRDFYKEITDHNDLLKTELTLSHFIPCDSEGKPMEEPHLWGEYNDETMCVFVKTKPLLLKECEDYQKGKESVMFEGFRISFKRGHPINHEVYLKDRVWIVEFRHGKFPFIRPTATEPERINTIGDLAEATKSNPLTLTK